MPRVRFYSPEILDRYQSFGASSESPGGSPEHHLAALLQRAAMHVCTQDEFSELIWEVNVRPTLRQLAEVRKTSAATELRKQRSERMLRLRKIGEAFIAVQLTEALENRGGATIDLGTGTSIRLRDGYLVSIRQFSRRYSQLPTIECVSRWLDDNVRRGTGLYPGSWWDSRFGAYWLDLNRWVPTRGEAVEMGASEGQEAIFDLNRMRTIRISPNSIAKAA